MEIVIQQPEAFNQAATQLLQYAGQRRKMAFYGEIGAGKTTFIQAICRQLGVHEVVVSPTFALVNEYTYQNATGTKELIYHLDLYRLKKVQEALDIGIEDMLYDESYCFIEWPELVEELLPDDVVRIKLSIIENSSRKILFL